MRPQRVPKPHTSAHDQLLASDLAISEERLRLALQAAHGGVWDWDLVSDYGWWSPEMYELWGMPHDTLMHLENSLAHIHADDRQRVRQEVEAAIANRSHFYSEFRLCPPGRSERWIASLGNLICDDDGEPTRLSGISLDITDRKRAEIERRELEARMLRSQKLESLGVLAGGIAHDFNNLLSVVMSYAGLAQQNVSPDSPAAPFLHEIQIALQRAGELTEQLFAYAGKGNFNVAPLHLDEVARETCCLLHARLPVGAKLEVDLHPAALHGDATQIRQVVMNLITNAADALEGRGGTIRVRTGVDNFTAEELHSAYAADELPPGQYAFIEVSDTGCGISPQNLPRIFEPFFTTKPGGSGLGIAAVQGIVRGHRGLVDVISELGQGTIFEVLLPACAAVVSPAPTPIIEKVCAKQAEFCKSKGKVLVIEHEPNIRQLATKALDQAGFETVDLAKGEDGRSAFEAQHGSFAAVVLDLTLPKVDGLELLHRFREIEPALPVVIISGCDERKAELAGMPGIYCLQKPFRSQELVTRLSQMILSQRPRKR